MTRIDFYILPESADAPNGLVSTACKLCDKAVTAGARVYVQTSDPTLAENFDGALWSFRQGAFIAHERYRDGPVEEPFPAVLIGAVEPPLSYQGVLINLDAEVPLYFSRFERVLEIVSGGPEQRAQSRLRYKFYRDRGYELSSHPLPGG